jgi:hypothetical protein
VVSARSKHIDIKHHFARERVANGDVSFEYISSAKNIADIFTKPLDYNKFSGLLAGLGMA